MPANTSDPQVPLTPQRIRYAHDLMAWSRTPEDRCPSWPDDYYDDDRPTWDERDTFDATPEEVAR